MNYIIEANIGIAFFYLVYMLILKNENDFTKQRLFLTGGIICAMIFPMINITTSEAATVLSTVMLPEVIVGSGKSAGPDFLFMAYIMIGSLVALPFVVYAIKIYRLSKREDGKYNGDYYIIESNDDLPSWSFFRLIYIGRASELSNEDKDLVLKHEMLHGRLCHSIDMVLITLLCIVFWLNPVLWLYRRTIAKVHEFEVDAIIARQNGAADYSALLAKTALARNGFLLTHHFNQSFILKRINMINMIKSKISNWKLGGLAAVVAIYFAVIACTEPMADNNSTKEKTIDKSGEVFTIVEKSATPLNGMTEFYADIANQLQYPEQARKMGVEGKVFVEFIVNKNGALSDFKILKGIGAGCDAEALRVLKTMKDWNPGSQDGTAVRQRMMLPITFKLN